MQFNVITGLPRSGSTLLCNILNQNPDFYASSTSPLPGVVAGMSHLFSNSPEVTAELARDADGTTQRLRDVMSSAVRGWYAGREEPVVFDKSRAWAANSLLLKDVFPTAKIIVTVRDLRGVFASIEKQHRKNPVLDHANNGIQKTVYARADTMFSPGGIIGGPILGVEDLLRRQLPDVVMIQYEALVSNPENTMNILYQKLEQPVFDHDFEHVENTAQDLDALYLNKFPHEGSGRVEAPTEAEWPKYVSADLAPTIMGRFPFYNQAFGYS